MVKPVEFWAGCCSTVAMSPGFLLGPKLIEHILQMWQTDLLVAAAKTGRVINIKKGQFCASSVMANSANKIRLAGNPNVMVCERGTMFGYSE
jgi:hypothetical protein